MEFVYPIIAGAAGGAALGILTYFQRYKEDGEKFDVKKFVVSLVPAVVIGASAGFLSSDTLIAFTAGILGKKIWETATA